VLGIVPAAGAGTRIQPLAFRKRCCRSAAVVTTAATQRPKAVSEFLIERMSIAGADRICVVISPEKTDIIGYYARRSEGACMFYVVQDKPLCLSYVDVGTIDGYRAAVARLVRPTGGQPVRD
jgi:glucose-1-phosphate thymidylyltransferase